MRANAYYDLFAKSLMAENFHSVFVIPDYSYIMTCTLVFALFNSFCIIQQQLIEH